MSSMNVIDGAVSTSMVIQLSIALSLALSRCKFAAIPFLCREETWSFCSSSKGANLILSNDPDHAGAQIASVSKQTRIRRINSLPLLFPVLLSKT